MGKTTAAKVAVGTGSFPSLRTGHSLLITYDGTENALLASVIGNNGFCCCFDEADMQEKQDFSSFIYRLASGMSKRRLTKEGQQKNIETYQTTVVSTAEKKLTRNSNQNTGKEIRVLTFDSVAWTNDAEHAEAVNAFVKDNYGRPLIHLARHMLKLGLDETLKRYEENRRIFLEQSLVNDNFTSRLSGKYAFILTAVELANECMDLELPYDYILDMLLKHEAETMDSRDIALKAHDYLLEQANVNHDKFLHDWKNTAHDAHKDLPKYRDVWGKKVPQKEPLLEIGGRKCTTIIYFAKGKFEELLHKGNFQEPSVVVKKLKAKGLLDHDGDRNTRTRQIVPGGQSVDVYALRVFENHDCDDVKEEQEMQREREEGKQTKPRATNKIKPRRKSILALAKEEVEKPVSKVTGKQEAKYDSDFMAIIGNETNPD